MRGKMKRAAACAAVAAGLTVALAGSASAMAMVGPACAARLAPAGSASCGFAENSGWALVSVEPVNGAITATVTCYSYGYTYTSSRTFESAGAWTTRAPGTSCSLTLSSDDPLAVGTGTASPWFPIYTEPV